MSNSRLLKKYKKEVTPALLKEFDIKNSHQVPKIVKIVVNSGIGEATKNKDVIDKAKTDLANITGQEPSVRKAKVSVASFGLRQGMPIGLKVTLRGNRMYVFFDKLVSIVLPRLRDFRGTSLKSFDNEGNYTLGFEEQMVFPEIDMTKSAPFGLEVTIVTSTKDKILSRRFLELMGMPFEKEE